MTETKDCTDCSGIGYGYFFIDQWSCCSTCNGSGTNHRRCYDCDGDKVDHQGNTCEKCGGSGVDLIRE